MAAGYSKTPLAKKLGLKPGMRAVVLDPPATYLELLGDGADGVEWTSADGHSPDFLHVFTDSRAMLEMTLPEWRNRIARDGMIWVSWPKKASKRPTDIVEGTIRDICLPIGLVDVKVCAVDDTWSGLKLVIRKALRD